MPYMELNGSAVVHPAHLRGEMREMGVSCDQWWGKANSFCHRRGADPSYGYLLITYASYVGSGGLRIVYDNPEPGVAVIQGKPGPKTEKVFQDIQIEWARKISPAANEQQGYYLVKVVDKRYALRLPFVGKRYNLATSFVSPEGPLQQGFFEYNKETIREIQSPSGGDPSYQPYTWAELFDEVFSLPGNPPLDKSQVTFPLYTPQDLDWRYVTRRDALEMLLQWTNTSIDVNHLGQFKLVAIDDPGGDKLRLLLTQLNEFRSKNVFEKTKEPGHETPEHLILHFRKLEPDPEVSEYHTISKDPSSFNVTKQSLPLRVPAYHTFAEGVTSVQLPDNIANGFFNLQNKYFDQFPSQEKTYGGFLYYSPDAVNANPIPIIPSGYVESVTWFDIGDGPKTRLISIARRDWLIRPHELSHPSLADVNIAVGRVASLASATTPSFAVDRLRVIGGSLPEGVNPGLDVPDPTSFIITNNTHFLDYPLGESITVFSGKGSDKWDTDRKGGTNVVRFELLEDKALADFARKAVLLTPDGVVATPVFNNTITVVDLQQKHFGYKAWDDPSYGPQRGYVGTAVFLMNNYFGSGFPGYAIIEMDGTARWGEGKLIDKFDPQDASALVQPSRYWGAYPNNRPPKTKEHTITGGSGGGVTYKIIDVFDDETSNDFKVVLNELPTNTIIRFLWDDKRSRYIFDKVPTSVPSVLDFGMIVSTIGPASDIDGVNHTANVGVGTSSVVLMELSSGGTSLTAKKKGGNSVILGGINLTMTSMTRPNSQTGVLVVGFLAGDEPVGNDPDTRKFVVVGPFDNRILPGHVKASKQVPFHETDKDDYRLGGRDCPPPPGPMI